MVKSSDFLVAIDDGHGPQTAGKRTPYIPSLGRSIRENEFNEPVANKFEAALKRCGIRTMQTAPGDYDTPLKIRTDRANAAKANLLVSIHFNAMGYTFEYSRAEGFSVHIQPTDKSNPNSGSLRFAKLAITELAKGTKQVNRGVVGQNLHMTRETHMPAALVECGFMDDPEEALLMFNPAFQNEVAEELAAAVCKYFRVAYIPVKVPAPKPVEKPKEEVKVAEKKTNEPSTWAQSTVKKAVEIGITDGSRLHDPVTREEAIVLAMRAAGHVPKLK